METRRIIVLDFGEDARSALRDLVHPPKHHLDEGQSLLLYAILAKSHSEMRRGTTDIDKIPFATQPYLMSLTGWPESDRPKLTRMLDPLRTGGYIVTAHIHDLEARKSNEGAMLCYEVNTKTAISNRGTALTLLTLLKLAEGQPAAMEGCVPIQALIETLQEKIKGRPNQPAYSEFDTDETLRKKLNELVVEGEHVEQAGEHHLRGRLRLYLERRYLQLIDSQPSDDVIKDRFNKYKAARARPGPGRR